MTSEPAQHEPASHCHNCGAAVDYHYCALCGQATRLHVPSASEFIHEFIGHYVALEGRLWQTLRYLMFKPGFLTAEYIAGRRVRYVEPLRVYLTLSILFFALLKGLGPQLLNFDTPPGTKESIAAEIAREKALDRNDEEGDINLAFAPALSAKINHFMKKPEEERKHLLGTAFYSYVPYALFCLMPLFALYLKLLYLGSGRRYGEHLLFALHTNAAAFAIFIVMFASNLMNSGFLSVVLLLWLLFYLPTAMRRVYGGGRIMTFVRWQVLSILHLISIVLAIGAASGLAIMN
ncbi:MAG: DUF3667 domain-containing protein [Massilia sp.]